MSERYTAEYTPLRKCLVVYDRTTGEPLDASDCVTQLNALEQRHAKLVEAAKMAVGVIDESMPYTRTAVRPWLDKANRKLRKALEGEPDE